MIFPRWGPSISAEVAACLHVTLRWTCDPSLSWVIFSSSLSPVLLQLYTSSPVAAHTLRAADWQPIHSSLVVPPLRALDLFFLTASFIFTFHGQVVGVTGTSFDVVLELLERSSLTHELLDFPQKKGTLAESTYLLDLPKFMKHPAYLAFRFPICHPRANFWSALQIKVACGAKET